MYIYVYMHIYIHIYIYIYIYVYIYIKQKQISNYCFMLVLRVSCLTQSFSQHSYTNKAKFIPFLYLDHAIIEYYLCNFSFSQNNSP